MGSDDSNNSSISSYNRCVKCEDFVTNVAFIVYICALNATYKIHAFVEHLFDIAKLLQRGCEGVIGFNEI